MKTFELTEELVQQLVDDNGGLCAACGEIVESGIEPDAENYTCEGCDEEMVFGMGQLLIMGAISFPAERPPEC